jgi:hypothetical protein
MAPINLASQEAEIRRIIVQRQLQQIVQQTLSQNYPTRERAGGVAQAIKYLPSKCEALCSNPSTTNIKQFT